MISLQEIMANAPIEIMSNQLIEIENDIHLLLKDNHLFLGSPLSLMNLKTNGKLNAYTNKINRSSHLLLCEH